MSEPDFEVPVDLHALAEQILGAKHESWWKEPSAWLDNQSPPALAKTVAGRRQLWDYLKRVETGTYT